MAMNCMNFGRIQDLVSNLGWNENNTYTPGAQCLDALESIEEELLNEDVICRNVHISLHICEIVKNDLIPILLHGKNKRILTVTTRILVNLSLPVECLSPVEETVQSNETQNIRKQLLTAAFEIKKAFLSDAATCPVVTMLREAIIKSEKHHVPLTEEDCTHLKNCLILLQNILHLPEEFDSSDTSYDFQMWQFVQNKLIWNLFVQGLDGALLLMLNSKYRVHWTIPLTLIIALLYRNQCVIKVHETLELISSASDTSYDEDESDGSKNSSTSLSSEPFKDKELSDSGCALASDTSLSDFKKFAKKEKYKSTLIDCFSFDIHTELEKVQISEDSDHQMNVMSSYEKCVKSPKSFMYGELDSESSSCSESPHHKKIKGSAFLDEQVSMSEVTDYSSKEDLGIIENMDSSSPDIEGNFIKDSIDKKSLKYFKAVQKLRSLQMHTKVSESDSSNEDMQNVKKYRGPPPAGRRGKSPRRNNGCTPAVCMDSALAASAARGRLKYPLWEKRNSVTTLVDINSVAPTNEEIGNHIKEFTMSFLHSGFCHLVQDLKDLLLSGSFVTVDKSLLFWLLSYFLHLATTVHLNIDHISNVLNPHFIGYLVYECVSASENVELRTEANMKIKKYLFDQLSLIVSALKEIMITIDTYGKRSTLQKDKVFFADLCGKLAGLHHLTHIPLLLFHNCRQVNMKGFTEDIVILNHYILAVIEKGMEQYPESEKFNFVQHLKHFSTKNVMTSLGSLLGNYKYNSNILNECLFTMMHHIAGDVHASDSLMEPSILKSFSSILKEDTELEPYQEDLILYILNKFRQQIQRNHLKKRKDNECSAHTSSSSSSVNSNCLLSEDDDDLFWWYLQFEQDKDPIARISEHIPTSKRDILAKLHFKGIISSEKYESLEAKMENKDEGSNEILSCEMEKIDDDITHLLRSLVQSGLRQHLAWIQDTLLETCYVKLGLSVYLPEPVPLYSNKMMTSVPLVPYSEEQRLILKDEMFLLLLKKIGFHLGSDMSSVYPRIPFFWSADVLFTIAARLGPMRKGKLKFSYDELLLANSDNEPITSRILPYFSLPALPLVQ